MAHRQRIISTTYPYLQVKVHLRGREYDALALVDTGFTGDVVIPVGVIDATAESPDAAVDWQVADGAVVPSPIYFAEVEIVGFPPVEAAITVLGDEYLLGTGVIDNFQVTFDHGRRLIVEP